MRTLFPKCQIAVSCETLTLGLIIRIVLDKVQQFGLCINWRIAMNVLMNAMMRQEERLIVPAVIGVLTAPLALLPGMGLFIAI